MTPDVEHTNNDDYMWRMQAYADLLGTATEKRKETISVINLCKKLNTKRSVIYRMESGANDVKVSTLINYLHGFGFHLEIVPDTLEIVPGKTKDKTDMVIDLDGLPILVEHGKIKKEQLNKKQRIALLKLIASLYEKELGDDEE